MAHLHEDKIKFLEETANRIRYDTIEMVIHAGSGHIAGPLDMADIFTLMYFHVLNHDPQNPDWPERDRLILSNGHICPVPYSAMAHAGYFPVKELKALRQFGSRLQGHPHRASLPGLETTSGPLGSGLSQAVGMAMAALMDNKTNYFFCLTSDAEHDAGNTWEAAMLAGREKLWNLIGIIDRNNIQIDGMTEDIMPLESLRAKYESFNWHVIEANGHDFEEMHSAIEEAKVIQEKPTVIIAHTIAGKGVGFMERKYPWHSKNFTPEEAKRALDELRTLGGKIKSEHQ